MGSVSQKLTMSAEDFNRIMEIASRHSVTAETVIGYGVTLLEAIELDYDDHELAVVFLPKDAPEQPEVQRIDPWKWLAA